MHRHHVHKEVFEPSEFAAYIYVIMTHFAKDLAV